MKVNYEKIIEVNNHLKVNVDEQQNCIKDLKEEYNKDDKDKLHIISGAGTPMKKNKSVCLMSNKNLERKKNS